MATPNPNPNPNPNPPQFDVQMLFRPPNPNPNYPPYLAAPPPQAAPPPPHSGAAFNPNYPFTPTFTHHRPPNPNPNPNHHGARLMALLTPPPLESATSMPPAPSSSSPQALQASNSAPSTPARVPSVKLPRGRYLGGGEKAVYDVDARLAGESLPPQLEVTPITKYNSDPGLVLGRQIAVNRSYICYGLKMGNIRVLDINTALRELLRGHTQRVTDMAFFAEDVHLLASASVEGRVYIWKIDEGPDQENKPQISGKRVVAIQIAGDRESYHPRICWHSHKQEILFVGIGNYVLKIDTTKVGRGKDFSEEGPLLCPVGKLIDGVQLIGKHDGEVTDLSISQWMTTRLVSASKDGTIKIWGDRSASPVATLRPHDGQPVNSVEFLTSPHRPDHIVLVTAGSHNKELKLWTSATEEGWLLPSDSESWQCTQTLELKSSAEPKEEEAFFNQVVVLPRASLVLLANAKKNAIYAVHVDYGSTPASTCMDYIADFTVAMPILSVTGTADLLPDGQQLVQVYCVQTQAIQQYALDLSQCLPPPNDNILSGKDSCISRGASGAEALDVPQPSQESSAGEPSENIALTKPSFPVSSYENVPAAVYPTISSSPDLSSSRDLVANDSAKSTNLSPSSGADVAASSPLPSNLDLYERVTIPKSSSRGGDQGHSLGDRNVDQSVIDFSANRSPETVSTSEHVVPSTIISRNIESKSVLTEMSQLPNSHLMYKLGPLGAHPAHLITPAEILSGAISSPENNLTTQGEGKVHDPMINNVVKNAAVEVKAPSEGISNQHEVVDLNKQPHSAGEEFRPTPPTADAREGGSLRQNSNNVEEACLFEGSATAETLDQRGSIREEDAQDNIKDMPEKVTESSVTTDSITVSDAKGTERKGKQSQEPDSSSPSSPLNSNYSSREPGISFGAPLNEMFSQILSIQETVSQLANMPTELQKQLNTMVAASITKEGKRLETALGRSMEKAVKANIDALWARVQEENAKREKERTQQITNLITNCMSKDLPSILERVLKKEISAVGPNLARAIAPTTEKAISSAIAESFQRGVGDKAVNQLDKSVNSKLEATVARQIQAQFQTSGKQALQDALRSTMESSVIPAFEVSCRTMLDQVDTTVKKGLTEYSIVAQQQNESKTTPLALTLRDVMSSTSSLNQNVNELADGNRKIIALLTAGNSNTVNPIGMQQSNGSMTGRPDMQALSVQQIEAPLDPTKELARLVAEHKYAEAFTSALQRSDVSMVSWLCSQVDLHGICSTVPLPLSQGVLLALLQQLACDINNDTSRKLSWVMHVALAINPADPMITLHVRPILEQVYNILGHLRPSSTSSTPDVRAIMHVINSILLSCK